MNKYALWSEVLDKSNNALISGSLKPFKTKLEIVKYNNYNYEIRSLVGKPRKKNLLIGPTLNPFSPWDKNLEIKGINEEHTLILNKYPVELGHMLLISNKWQPQDGWLTITDWEALTTVETEISGFWFFNNSSIAGASQPHRHLQFLRRSKQEDPFPRYNWFNNILENRQNDLSKLARSCFALKRKNYNKVNSASELEQLYFQLCCQFKLGNPEYNNKPLSAYNLLITNKWIALIRRSKESFNGFSINALGFAGYFLATNQTNMDWIREKNPLIILNQVVYPS